MFKNIRLSLFALLFVGVFTSMAVDNDSTQRLRSVFTPGVDWLLDLPFISGYADSQNNALYEPQFSQKSSFKVSYIVGIHPLHNPKHLFEIYGPIVDFLNEKIPEAHFKLEASRNSEEYEKKLFSGYFDFAMPNPYQTLKSLKHGYQVFGKMADDENFRGIILVRRDSGIKKVTDLKGKAVSYPAATALAATMMPQYYLYKNGINVNTDIENRYVGSQESSIMNVLEGHVAAGAIWSASWQTFSEKNPQLAAQLEVKWQTPFLQNNGWVVRKDVPLAVYSKVAMTLFSLHESQEGKALLARIPVSRFVHADNSSYQPVQDFLEKFTKTVRSVE